VIEARFPIPEAPQRLLIADIAYGKKHLHTVRHMFRYPPAHGIPFVVETHVEHNSFYHSITYHLPETSVKEGI
jgi:hypothetical protein